MLKLKADAAMRLIDGIPVAPLVCVQEGEWEVTPHDKVGDAKEVKKSIIKDTRTGQHYELTDERLNVDEITGGRRTGYCYAFPDTSWTYDAIECEAPTV